MYICMYVYALSAAKSDANQQSLLSGKCGVIRHTNIRMSDSSYKHTNE